MNFQNAALTFLPILVLLGGWLIFMRHSYRAGVVPKNMRMNGHAQRVDISRLAWLQLALAAMWALKHDLVLAGLAFAVSMASFVAHVIRVRRFKRFDERKDQVSTFE